MTGSTPEPVPIRTEQDVVRVRQLVREASVAARFSLVEQTKLVTAASELGRNTLVHGGGGEMRLETLVEGTRRGIRLVFRDQGPGIADVELAMREGYTSGSGLGLGLSGAKKLVSEFAIETVVGQGTSVTVTRWK